MKPRPILIVNPTKFLGNLLISLGLIQEAVRRIELRGQPYVLIFDEIFKPFVQPLFKPESLIFYPRTEIKKSGVIGQLLLYLSLLRKIRKLQGSIAIDMEGDSVSSMLTILAGANSTLGPYGTPRAHWYQMVSKPKLENESSEFFKYRNILASFNVLPFKAPMYGSLKLPTRDKKFLSLIASNGINDSSKLIVLHTGASKKRKFWPSPHWVKLIELLQTKNMKPILIGAGKKDAENNQAINARLAQAIPDLTNQLGLVDLAQLINMSRFYIGNDSGPMHLATSLNIPGIAIFGPTNDHLWGPLLPNMTTMRGHKCPTSCRNGHHCETEFSCLKQLTPEILFQQIHPQLFPVKRIRVTGNKCLGAL